MARASRLLDLMQALRGRRRPVTAETLAAQLGVSVRTVYRDIATLAASGAPIEGEAGLGYVLAAGHFLPPLMFNLDEIDALTLGLQLVARRSGDPSLVAAAGEALAKIAAVLPPALANEPDASGLIAGPRMHPGGDFVPLIRTAMRQEQRVRLSYVDGEGRATDRIVWPVALAFFEASEVLAAWCETRADFRHFRLDRIRGADPTGQRYPRRRRLLLAEWREAVQVEAPDRI